MQEAEGINLAEALNDLVQRSEDGTRLPTIRELMREYGVGQATVQSALSDLKEQGLISAQVGRGSYVTKSQGQSLESGQAWRTQAGLGHAESVLILSNSSMNERCLRVQNTISDHMRRERGHVVQMSFSDTDHLMDILKTIPVFDAVVLQSHYEVIPVRLLAMLQARTRTVIVDGHTVSGVDVHRMGIDWEEAIDLSLSHLAESGARHIGLMTLESSSQPLLAARRYFERSAARHEKKLTTKCILLDGLIHPSQDAQNVIQNNLHQLKSDDGKIELDALLFLGISDGRGILEAFTAENIDIPGDLKVIVLGHTDVPSEHIDFFTIAGGTSREGADCLISIIERRSTQPHSTPIIEYIPSRLSVGKSSQ